MIWLSTVILERNVEVCVPFIDVKKRNTYLQIFDNMYLQCIDLCLQANEYRDVCLYHGITSALMLKVQRLLLRISS